MIYNDINKFTKQIVESFKTYDTYDYLKYIYKIIDKFGLEAGNAESYYNALDYYNSFPLEKRDPRILFTVIMYGFQQQIRFNSHHDFNNPVGMRWFNDCVLEKMISFSRVLKNKNVIFNCADFADSINNLSSGSFVYMDPPYRLTNGSYNDGKRGFEGWTLIHERKMREFADALAAKGIQFMISYVFSHAGKDNKELQEWCKTKNYNIFQLDAVPRRRPRKEVLITNYGG